MSEAFVGSGWSFPLRTDRSGSIALASGDREIEEAIALVIGTAPGERPMRPEYGCAIHDFVFAPADATTAGRIAYEVRVSLDRWEPRVEVTDVVVTSAPDDASTLYVDIRYVRRGTNDPRNLVFPFYLIPAEN
jgi:phage baseplate assembly protein W